ncbi:MAG: hypothetical protein AAF600_19750 [Bacteroidota bacterium]
MKSPKILITALLATFLLSTCEQEQELQINSNQPLTVAEAKAWFENNDGISSNINGRNIQIELPIKPVWSFAIEEQLI